MSSTVAPVFQRQKMPGAEVSSRNTVGVPEKASPAHDRTSTYGSIAMIGRPCGSSKATRLSWS